MCACNNPGFSSVSWLIIGRVGSLKDKPNADPLVSRVMNAHLDDERKMGHL